MASTEIIKGYKFDTESEAIDGQNQCNVYYGIPAGPDDETTNWVGYYLAEFNDPQFYYIIYDESLDPVLGNFQEIELVTSNN